MKTKITTLITLLALLALPAIGATPFSLTSEATSFGTLTNFAVIPEGAGRAAVDTVVLSTGSNYAQLTFLQCVWKGTVVGTNAIGTNLVVAGTNAHLTANSPCIIYDASQRTFLRCIYMGTMTNHATSERAQVNINTNGCKNYNLGTNISAGSYIYVMNNAGVLPFCSSGVTIAGGNGTFISCTETNAGMGMAGGVVRKDDLFVGGNAPTNLCALEIGYQAVAGVGTGLIGGTNKIHYVGGRHLGTTPY